MIASQALFKHCAFLVLLLSICGVSTHAQSTSSYNILQSRLTVEDGLISNTTLCGLQDSWGFIWFGTTEGLQRYDGRLFRLFSRDQGGLRENKIGTMAEDKDGQMWLHYGSSAEALLRTGRTTDVMDLRTYRVQTLANRFGKALPFAPEELKWFFSDEQRNLFLITGDESLWWYRGKGSFKKLLSGRLGYSFFPHGSLYQAWGGHIWLSSDTEIIRVDTLGHLVRAKNPAGTHVNNVFQIKPDGGCVALASPSWASNGAEKPSVPAKVFEASAQGTMQLSNVRFLTPVARPKADEYLLEYRADIRTRAVMFHNPRIGLQLLTDSGSILIIDTAVLAQEAPLSPYAYFTDRSGGHWLCTSLGVYRFQISPAYFTNYLTRSQLPSATAVAAQARGIWDDGAGNILIARGGLYKVTKGQQSIERLSERSAIAIGRDSSGIWFSHGWALSRLSHDFKPRSTKLMLSEGRTIWTIYRTADGRLLIGGDSFVGLVDSQKLIPLNACNGDALASACYQFFESRDGTLWAVTSTGVLQVHKRCYTLVGGGKMKLPSTRLHYIHEDKAGGWWLCTAGDGLIYWNRKTGLTKRYGLDEGLPSNVLYACLADANGFFWISSNNGLIRFNPETGSVKSFAKKDGLPHNEFNRVSSHLAPDGRMYFGGLNGVTAFYPSSIPRGSDVFNAPLRVLALHQYSAAQGRLVDKTDELLSSGRINLAPDDKFLTLEVAMLDYAPGKHRFDYKVDGLDETWRTSSDGMLRLDNLRYGSYTLRVRGQNADGKWSKEELRIPLKLTVPFYRKAPFIIGMAVVVLLLSWLGIRTRLRMLERTNRRLEAVVAKRTQELQSSLDQKDILMKEIHHRVKNNLQVISALQQMQSSRTADPLVKAALEESQNRVLSIAFIHHNLYMHDDLKGVEMKSFIQELVGHISSVYATTSFTVDIEEQVEAVSIDIDTAVPLGLIINELLTNSFKYAFRGRNRGHISIGLRGLPAEGLYELQYRDDGPGLPTEIDPKKAKSLGLRLIRQLSRQLEGEEIIVHGVGAHFALRFKNYEARNRFS